MAYNFKKTTFIVLSILLIMISACNGDKSRRLPFYHEALAYITDSSLYSHFPDEDLIRKRSVSIPCVGGSGLEIEIFLPQDQNQIENFVNGHQELNTYSITDPCTNYYLNNNDSLMLKYGDCINKNPPVPDYVLWLDPHETMFDYEDIKDDLTYYIIESKSGKYLPDSLLTKMSIAPSDCMYNGTSRGYAISKNAQLLVYWLLIW
jgi:hypothetical protein